MYKRQRISFLVTITTTAVIDNVSNYQSYNKLKLRNSFKFKLKRKTFAHKSPAQILLILNFSDLARTLKRYHYELSMNNEDE